jgi:ABC-2 type transport system ATP-binding protein
MNAITVQDLSMVYRVPVRDPGLLPAVKSIFRRRYEEVEAVRRVSFTVKSGEIVGLIGPNGAGKTTTLKLLSGLLRPTGGNAEVEGFVPYERRHEYLRSICMVLGNRRQIVWDVPPQDSLRAVAAIYGLSDDQFRKRLAELSQLLRLEPILSKPARNLSLGERMKCELAASLIHRPRIMFLDEPTLGLDLTMQRQLRSFIAECNRRDGTTIILTSHYMADVSELCPRILLINNGRLAYDGPLNDLARRIAPYKFIRIRSAEQGFGGAAPPTRFEIVEKGDDELTFRVPTADAPAATAELLTSMPIADLHVEDAPIESVIDTIYREGVGCDA